jgi:hypothetical protein
LGEYRAAARLARFHHTKEILVSNHVCPPPTLPTRYLAAIHARRPVRHRRFDSGSLRGGQRADVTTEFRAAEPDIHFDTNTDARPAGPGGRASGRPDRAAYDRGAGVDPLYVASFLHGALYERWARQGDGAAAADREALPFSDHPAHTCTHRAAYGVIRPHGLYACGPRAVTGPGRSNRPAGLRYVRR